jgi:hypothetical protein
MRTQLLGLVPTSCESLKFGRNVSFCRISPTYESSIESVDAFRLLKVSLGISWRIASICCKWSILMLVDAYRSQVVFPLKILPVCTMAKILANHIN